MRFPIRAHCPRLSQCLACACLLLTAVAGLACDQPATRALTPDDATAPLPEADRLDMSPGASPADNFENAPTATPPIDDEQSALLPPRESLEQEDAQGEDTPLE